MPALAFATEDKHSPLHLSRMLQIVESHIASNQIMIRFKEVGRSAHFPMCVVNYRTTVLVRGV
jgi:hypothetical protein